MNKSTAISCKTTARKPMVTQMDILMPHLKRRYLTTLDALRLAGCMAFSQRMSELAAAGRQLSKKWVRLPDGRKVMSYRLVK